MPLLLALPGLSLLVTFHFVAVGAGSWYAFTSWNAAGPARWVGLANFRELLRDPTTRGALIHTFELAGSFFVLVNLSGLALALGLNRTLKSRHLLRSLFFVPFVMSPLAVSFIWLFIFDYTGALNRFLGAVGLGSWKQAWLGSPSLALWTILVVMVWQYSGLTMAVYLAGLQGIQDELMEAAAVDGASSWRRFRQVTFPLLAPAITVNATLTAIIGLRVFDQVLALTNGGPVNASETLATQVWRQTFVNGRFGYGAANALVLTAAIAAVTLIQLVLLRAREARI